MLYLENARNNFSAAGSTFAGDGESSFYHRVALMIPDKVDVNTLILAMKIALQDEEKSYSNTFGFISLVPRYVDQIATPEFAIEFRKKYLMEVLGLQVNDINEEVDYGCNEIEPDVIDVSSKDLGEVFAALYNASAPIGAGFFQYDSEDWDKSVADRFFVYSYGENYSTQKMSFDYVKGRNMEVTIEDNIIYVKRYNIANGIGLAQRVIKTIPDKGLDPQKLMKDRK